MNYIKKMTIENFQSHTNTELEFTPGLNVIVGPSDQGKSAIIRALKWVLFNEPRGMEFITQGASTVRVFLEISNGYKVIRERSSSKNRYVLVQPDETTSVYEGFGNDVPEEIINAHGISKVVIDTDSDVSLNLGEQLEGPFLISQTGAVRAKAIGRLTGVHVIDKAIRDCISDVKKENQTESRCRREIEDVENKLKSYEELETLNKSIKQREKSLSELESLLEKLNKLKRRQEMLKEANINIDKSKCFLDKLEKVNEAELNLYKLSEKKMLWERLIKLKKNYKFVESELKKQEDIIKNTHNIAVLNENISKLDDNINIKTKLDNLRKSYIEINKSIDDGNIYIKKVSEETAKYIQSYETELRKISKCPICFNSIDDGTISKIISQYQQEGK